MLPGKKVWFRLGQGWWQSITLWHSLGYEMVSNHMTRQNGSCNGCCAGETNQWLLVRHPDGPLHSMVSPCSRPDTLQDWTAVGGQTGHKKQWKVPAKYRNDVLNMYFKCITDVFIVLLKYFLCIIYVLIKKFYVVVLDQWCIIFLRPG